MFVRRRWVATISARLVRTCTASMAVVVASCRRHVSSTVLQPLSSTLVITRTRSTCLAHPRWSAVDRRQATAPSRHAPAPAPTGTRQRPVINNCGIGLNEVRVGWFGFEWHQFDLTGSRLHYNETQTTRPKHTMQLPSMYSQSERSFGLFRVSISTDMHCLCVHDAWPLICAYLSVI